MNKKNVLIIIGSQLLILIFLTLYANMIFYTGTRTLLQVIPIDPQDVFRGDYVVLGYDFSNIEVEDSENFFPQNIYVVLEEKENGIFEMKSYSFEKPKEDVLFIKGEVYSYYNDLIFANYGIEAYFIEENTGRSIEEKIIEGTVYAEVFIDKNGFARVRSLIY